MGCVRQKEECSKFADRGYDRCTQTRDAGYNQCTASRDEGYRDCCTWWPCSWACRAWTWIANIVCVVWTWIANIVCVAWTWIKNIVCVAWRLVTIGICFVLDTAVKILLSIPIIKAVVGGVLNFACKNKKAPRITTPREAKSQLAKQLRDNKGNAPFKELSGFDKWIAWLTTPVFKENGICGWTNYGLKACTTGQVEHTALSEDGIYTVDVLMIAEGQTFTVEDEDGITKPNYMRAEIFAEVVAKAPRLPQVGNHVTLCGVLHWDGDGWLEIHPRNPEDIVILKS